MLIINKQLNVYNLFDLHAKSVLRNRTIGTELAGWVGNMVVLDFPKLNEDINGDSIINFIDLKIEISKNEHVFKNYFDYDTSSDLAKEIIDELESDISEKFISKTVKPITF